MKEVILKQTQGNKKLRQYVDDLLRNEHFMKAARELFSATDSRPDRFDEIMILVNEYRKLDKRARKFLKEYDSKLDGAMDKMVEKYGLDTQLLAPVLPYMTTLKIDEMSEGMKESILYGGQFDMCFLVDNEDEQLNPAYTPPPLALDMHKKNHIKAFPVSIDLHRFATKRDVLDYIEKEWPRIENVLGIYREYKNIKFRKRKLDRKLLDFIWDHRNLHTKELKRLLDKEFPANGLGYYELYKIISLEKQRRRKKIIVGQ